MYCSRCGNEISNNSLRCEYCGIKVQMICPHCRALNKFGAQVCSSCSSDLIKFCPECNAANLSTAEVCRKCGISFIQIDDLDFDEEIIEKPVLEDPKEEVVKTEMFDFQPQRVEVEQIADLQEEMFELSSPEEVSEVEEPSLIDNLFIEEFVEEKEEPEPQPQQGGFNFDENLVESLPEEFDKTVLFEEVDEKRDEDVVSDSGNSVNEPGETSSKDQEAGDIEIRYYSQIQAKQKIINTIKNSIEKSIIAINGEEGSGKSIVLQYVIGDLQPNNIVALLGECTPLTQISNYGFIQDLFLRFLSLPAFVSNVDLFIKNNKKIFENVFSLLTPDEVLELINFLYPHKTTEFEDILNRKSRLFDILEKAFRSIMANNKVVIVADDFDLIDGSSYEFLMRLIDNGFFEDGLKLLIAYKERRVAQSYFYSTSLRENIFENIYLDNLSNEQVETFLSNFVNGNLDVLPTGVYELICQNSRGNASYLEQVMALLHDRGNLYFENENVRFRGEGGESLVPPTIEEVLAQRLGMNLKMTPVLKNILFLAAIMGYKFDIQILSGVLNIPNEQLESALNQLRAMLYIIPISPYTYVFKSLSLWRHVFELAKQDEFYSDNNKKLFSVLDSCVLSNNSLKAIVAQNLSNPSILFEAWQNNANLTAYVGDINLYVISQKQCLKVLSEISVENSQAKYNDICEKIGKLIYKSNPIESIEYLSNVISTAKKAGDSTRVVDLCGYIVSSCYKVGSFHGVIEAVDMIISLVQQEASELEIALIKARKLKALFSIGNCEEVINIINNEVLSIIEEALAKPSGNSSVMTMIYETWLETNLVLADAYSVQGNSKGIDVIDNVLEIMQINKLESRYYQTKAAITKAFSATVVGKIKNSYEILNDITEAYKDDVLDSEFLSQWNLIYVINQILTHKFANLKEELFSLATFANNTNDQFSKNIIKTILGYIIQQDGNYAKALEIYNEQVTYFAKEKIATGALLCWFLIAQITLTVEGADKALDIASKALEVAQNPRINNYNFMVYLQKFIAEIYIIKGDLDATKMYLEKALLIAKQFGMKYAQVELYLAFAKYIEEVISIKVVNKSEFAQNALKMYEYALSMAIELDLENLISMVNKQKAAFRTYCQLNSIDIK